jgi:hypothetical protein
MATSAANMTEAETRAVERLVKAADRIEQFRVATERRKPVPLLMLQALRLARRHVKHACGI